MLPVCSGLQPARPGRAVLPSCDSFASGTKLHVCRRRATAEQVRQRKLYPAIGINVGFSLQLHADNMIFCSASSKAAPAQKPAHDRCDSAVVNLEEQQRVHVEFSIRKTPTYTWPPQHKVVLRLVSSTEVHPVTGEGMVSSPVSVFLPPGEATAKINIVILIPQGFGTPVALLLDSPHREEFFLESLSLRTNDSKVHHFWCNSWITETQPSAPRIFFSNEVYLPNHTPPGLAKLRLTELKFLKGDGTGRRLASDRIYDYDVYNDLGDPDLDEASARPVLGGSQALPYPRRCRTGRERTVTDPESEAPEPGFTPYYVPRDEQFSATKQEVFNQRLQLSKLAVASCVRDDLDLVSNEIPTFASLQEIYSLYADHLFPVPPIIQVAKDAWWTDEEFARQRLAGLNPLMIERVKAFPLVSTLDPEIYGPATSAITAHHIEHNLEGITVEQAVNQKRLFALDYHDALLPALQQVNASDVKVYASRTLLFLTSEGVLRPIAIELSLPPHNMGPGQGRVNRVFTPPMRIEHFPGQDMLTWQWQLAKAQVAINDTGYHQLISHWLRTHACVEPFVIATHRQLSVLHPLHRLLSPHLKDTMSINGLARKHLISSDGVIESSFFPRDLCMQFSSLVYKSWRFDEQALPQDLVKRGMAERDADNRLTLTIKDYPYAVDGLELWEALQTWVRDYLAVYYENDQAVRDDSELQNWWKEIKETGHGDHRQGEWWGVMDTKKELEEALVTLIWISSGHHAAVNFGQYAYAGFMPNSPTLGRRFIPEDSNAEELLELSEDPERFLLSSLSSHLEATSVMGTLLLLSQHIEEEFLGQATNPNWTSDPRVLSAFDKFSHNLKQVESNIEARNQDPNLHKSRYGPAQIPYKLLFPSSDQGMTYQGVPNSISI